MAKVLSRFIRKWLGLPQTFSSVKRCSKSLKLHFNHFSLLETNSRLARQRPHECCYHLGMRKYSTPVMPSSVAENRKTQSSEESGSLLAVPGKCRHHVPRAPRPWKLSLTRVGPRPTPEEEDNLGCKRSGGQQMRTIVQSIKAECLAPNARQMLWDEALGTSQFCGRSSGVLTNFTYLKILDILVKGKGFLLQPLWNSSLLPEPHVTCMSKSS